MMLSNATKPPAFDETDRNAVTGVGAPSYVSGAQKWKGTALTLNANPTRVRKIATASSGFVPSAVMNSEMFESSVEPLYPKISDMPYSISADDSTPMM